jgi:hypothetical protein
MSKPQFAVPSRDDAWLVTRQEKLSILFLMNTVSAMMDSREELKDRIGRIDGGPELMDTMCGSAEKLLTEIRRTIPTEQRHNINNVSKDMEMRMTPKATPRKTSVVMQKDEFRTLVDAAQEKCKECTDDNDECRKCKLFRLLTVILPMDSYDGTFLCPYNAREWEN